MTHTHNLHHASATSGVPPLDAYAARIAGEAGRWLAFANARSRMQPHTLTRKAFAACAFTVARSASSFAVPSKLSGTSQHQRRLWAMVREMAPAWSELTLDATGDGLTALYDSDPVVKIQTKHLPWLRSLVPFGARLYLGSVTGSQRDRATLGVNVVIGHVGTALGGLLDALGQSGDGQGDGAQDGSVSASAVVPEFVVSRRGGALQEAAQEVTEAAPPPLRLVVLPESESLSGDPDDVILWRRLDGSGHASVPHIQRHSGALDWGRLGAGPADLAFSVLAALCGEPAAETHSADFAFEVVCRVPFAGGVIRANDVRTWVAAQDSPRPAA